MEPRLTRGGSRPVANPVAGARPKACRAVVRVRELAAVEREAAAADALGQPGTQALELGDAVVDPGGPLARKARPVAAGGGAVWRQLGQLAADLLQAQPDPLRKDDERDP